MKLSKLEQATDEVTKNVLKAGAKVVYRQVKFHLVQVIGNNTKYDSKSTGELVDSLGVSPPKLDRNGNFNIKIGFNEPRKKQYSAKRGRNYYDITNAMLANIIEYGKHGQPAKPFLARAKRASKALCEAAMKKKFEEEVEKL